MSEDEKAAVRAKFQRPIELWVGGESWREARYSAALNAMYEALRREPDGTRGSGRGIVKMAADGASATCEMHTYLADGYRRDLKVTVSVVEVLDPGDDYWLPMIAKDQDGRGVVVDGVHYRLGKATKPSDLCGHAGRWFGIEYLDGRRIKTCDLWYQGPIPEPHRPALPDNAKFIDPSDVAS